MAFGQASGPPASRKQLEELEELLGRAGFADFREARYPMDFTQRQAGGKFTRDEADDFIGALTQRAESGEFDAEPEGADGTAAPSKATPAREPAGSRLKVSKTEQALKKFSDQDLAAELQRRGWIVAEP